MKLKHKIMEIKNISNIILAMGIAIFVITISSLIFAMFVEKDDIKLYEDRIDFRQIFRFASPLFYFTSLSNLALGLSLFLFGWSYGNKNPFYFNFVFVATAWISITFLVYWGLLFWIGLSVGTKIDSFSFFISILVHGIHPLAGFLALHLVRGKFKVAHRTIFTAIFLFSIYGFFSLILYIIVFVLKGQPTIIYPFLDFERPFLYKGGNIWIVIFLDIILFGLLFATPFFTSIALIKIFKIEKIKSTKVILKIKSSKIN